MKLAPPGTTRWYQEPWMLLVLGIPLFAVVFGIAMLVVSVRGFDGVVEDDYYRRGLEINARMQLDKAAEALGLDARLSLRDAEGMLAIELSGPEDAAAPVIQVAFLHATRGGLDRHLLLPQVAAGRYRAPSPQLAPGRWDVLIETARWRLRKSVFVE